MPLRSIFRGRRLARNEEELNDYPRHYDYPKPSRACDILMKGGITSGVVYPHAVCELAKTYKLVNVGGTSAGAIAAAAAGAAELGRPNGFVKLAGLPAWIGAGDNLLYLFRPQKRTKHLFRVFLAGLGGGLLRYPRLLATAMVNFPITTVVAAAPGTAMIVIAALADGTLVKVAGITAGALLILLALALALPARLVFALGRVPKNGYGLCSGLGGSDDKPALTPWLTKLLNDLAGKPASSTPLTFGELRAGGINLEFMTTNLTLRRPYRLPWQTREYFLDPRELRRWFPPTVVSWLENNPPAPPAGADDAREWALLCKLLEPLRPLPAPDELPVIVGARMSLSFPLLLSAVPLWTLDMSRYDNQEALKSWNAWAKQHANDWQQLLAAGSDTLPAASPEAERCWFSDGGISSNFPVHFFDAPLPVRPTFAINLRPFHRDYPQSTDEEKNSYLPAVSGGGLLEWWYRFPANGGLKQVSAFAQAIGRTMQNRVDEAQMRVPGYRDRIAHVSLSAKEGGLNLKMSGSVIERLTKRGLFVARRLVERFALPPQSPAAQSCDSHRWTRYRAAVAALSEQLTRFDVGYKATADELNGPPYRTL